MQALLQPLSVIGRAVIGSLSSTGRTLRFSFQSIIATLSSRHGLRATAAHAVSLTIRCAIPVFLVCTPIGAMLALQGLELMRTVGVERMLAPLCTATIVRELSPGFAAVVVAMQGGAGIAAELGAMRASSEIDALEVMGVDPKRELAGPRILGAALAAPLLNASAMLCGVGGAFLSAVLLGVPAALFRQTALDGVGVTDVWVSEAKCMLFGLVLGSVCAAAGFFAPRDAAGVGKATNRAVVASVILILVCNYLFNTAIFGLRGGGLEL